ncbi:LCP family protein [Streptomyces sp. CB01373]|uniref:LCP family protein n=1 Tax=Streptomyces sp. CB01373 TaxID=2020325 RepID=UPI00131C79B5|nr:LytR C-terminal domain-containing protein [Streptomyces sp. CB01373]
MDIVLDSSWNVLDFAQQATNLTGGNVVFHTLPIEAFATRDGQEVNLVDPEKIKAMVRQEFGATPSPTATAAGAATVAPATVDVHNGNGAEGEAPAALSYLAGLGYTAGTTGNAAARPATTVAYGPGAQQAAQQIAGRFKAAARPPLRLCPSAMSWSPWARTSRCPVRGRRHPPRRSPARRRPPTRVPL